MPVTTSIKNKGKFTPQSEPENDNIYMVGTEMLTVEEKLKVLHELGKPELIEVFKGWRPRPTKKKLAAPLDQRVSITVTNAEREILDNELKEIEKSGSKTTASQFIRNRAMGNIDVNGWREIAIAALDELNYTEENEAELRKKKIQIAEDIEESDDNDEIAIWEQEINNINYKLGRLIALNEKRVNRLSGRMSMAESETVKWRAQRLCLSTSDYLRFQIFGLYPNSSADAHLSLDAKKRFYISIIDVADNGFGHPPTVYQCSQCANYLEEIDRLRDRVKQLEDFV